MNKVLESMLSDNSGGISSLRVLCVSWIILLMSVWIGVAIAKGELPDIPGGVLTLTGTLIGGKVVQRFGEDSE